MLGEWATYGGFFDVDRKKASIAELEPQMGESSFWNNQENAKKIIGAINQLKTSIGGVVAYQKRLDELKTLAELISESNEMDAQDLLQEAAVLANQLFAELDQLEIESFLTGHHDSCNAIMSIHSGAGGTESCDWTQMLLRQYTRWAERRGFTTEIEDIQPGEETGISRVTLRIIGKHAYGYSKAERGVHRLVRISPFDSNKRRHTTFCAVDVIAEIEDDVPIEIKEEDLRIDTYRSSGKGGQHVNKTESAIRITHIPTNIVVACQNERSQIKNRQTAMKLLKSRLFEKMQDEKRSEMEKFYSEKGEIAWGNQIRSYVFQPYQMIKDLRTGYETGNVSAFLDGDLDPCINAWLRAGGPTSRNKNFNMED